MQDVQEMASRVRSGTDTDKEADLMCSEPTDRESQIDEDRLIGK